MSKVLVIGGAEQFSDIEIAFKGIDATLKKQKIKVKDIRRVYTVGKPDVQGGFAFAKKWCEQNGVEWADGSPKFNEHGKNATEKRNEILSHYCDAFILLTKGTSTGGNTIIKAFEDAGKPVYRIDENEAASEKNPEHCRRIYSGIARTLLEISVTLDVETTGLSPTKDDIIELAVVDSKTGTVLFNDFVYSETPVNPNAFAVNNISFDMIKDSRKLPEVWKEIEGKIEGKIIVASNSMFDEGMVCFGLEKMGAHAPRNLWTCLQELFCKYANLPKKKIKTEVMARQLGIEPGVHRALSDAQAQVAILQAMAQGVVPDTTVT